MRPDLPAGTVTFLLTDVEASSVAWDERGVDMDATLCELEDDIASAVDHNGGVVIKSRGEGDSSFAVFDRASRAIVAAYEIQRALSSSPLRVRAAIHTGEALLRDGDYFGLVPNRTARLRSLAHGGQIVVSRLSAELAESELPEALSLFRLGTYRVRDWPRAQEVFGVRGAEIRVDFPALRVWGDKERAVMTIVTVDVAGTSAIAAGVPHSEFVGFSSALATGLRDTFARNNGCFMKLMGDGCIALFEDPIAAVAFARTIDAWATRTLITIHPGIVELMDDDIVGRALYEAVHLRKHARPGEIVVSRTGADLLSGLGLTFERRPSDDEDADAYVLASAYCDARLSVP